MTPFSTLPKFLLSLALCSLPFSAHALYACTDKDGKKTISSVKITAPKTQCTLLSSPKPSPPPAQKARANNGGEKPPSAARTPTPESFPKVDNSAQRVRDNDRRRILEDELAQEKRHQQEAQRAQAEAKTPEAKAASTDKAQLHARNIEAIEREIAKVR